MGRWMLAFIAVGLVANLAGPARAEDANAAFLSLYGADMKRVTATSDTKDDLELAGQLLAAAKKTASQPDLLAVLCEKTYDLTVRVSAGHPTAIEAMELLGEKVPEKRSVARAKLLTVYQQDFPNKSGSERQGIGETMIDLYLETAEDRADANDFFGAAEQARKAANIAEIIHSPMKEEALSRATEWTLRDRLEKQVVELQARLRGDPTLSGVREDLVRKLLVDLDRPAEAATFVDNSIADQTLRTYVPMAGQPPASLAETACLELAEWYKGLGDKATTSSKDEMYQRAKGYYQVFLDKHTTEDLARAKAKLALENLSALLLKLSLPGEGKGWVDVLKFVDLTKHVVGGKWERQDQKLLVAGWPPSRATIPVVPDGSYELLVQFTRKEGNGPIALLLPVGQAWCALEVAGRTGPSAGLHMVSGRPYVDPNTAKVGLLESGKEYALEAKVLVRGKTVTISVELNGQLYLWWQGSEAMLSASLPNDIVGPRALGLATVDSSLMISSARLRLLSGSAAMLQEAKPTNQPFPNWPWGNGPWGGARRWGGGGRGPRG